MSCERRVSLVAGQCKTTPSVHTTESTDTENLNQNLDDDVNKAVDIETAAQHSAANAVVIQPDVKLVAEIPVIRNLFEWVQSAFV